MTCTDPQRMVDFLRGRATERKLRLFACAFSRRLWPELFARDQQREEGPRDRALRHAVETAERYADGAATRAELASAHAAVAAFSYCPGGGWEYLEPTRSAVLAASAPDA